MFPLRPANDDPKSVMDIGRVSDGRLSRRGDGGVGAALR